MTQERPAVSVIMLCYNEATFIRRAIRSVLAQGFDASVEVVLVDDGSTDDSAAIVREEIRHAGRKNITFRLVTNLAPTGNAAAFVAGLEAARGRYYHVLDCDDYWIDPDKLQIQVGLMEADPALAGVGHRTIIRNQIDQTESFHPEREPSKQVLHLEDLAVHGVYFHTSAMLFRNHFYQPATDSVAVPGIFREVRGDTIRLYVHATEGAIRYIPQSMSVYDDHGGGIWTGLDWPGKQALLRNLYDRMEKHGYLANMDDAAATAFLTQRLTEIAAYAPTTLRPVSLYPADVLHLSRYRLANISHIRGLRDLEIQMGHLIEDARYEEALHLLQRLVTAIAYDPNLSRIGRHRRIASFEVDWQCARLGEKIGIKYNVLPTEAKGSVDGPVVFVVSGVVDDKEGIWQETLDILRLYQGRRDIVILSTETLSSSAMICEALHHDGIKVLRNTDALLEEKAAWVMWHLAQQAASQIFVNPLRNDVALMAGVRRQHADRIHLLTALETGFALGRQSGLIDGFVARRPYDLAYYKKIAPEREIAFIPTYPRDVQAEPRATLGMAPLISVSACSNPEHIEQAYDYSYEQAIPQVLGSGVARHIHIGPLSEATINRIRKGLAERGLLPDAFEIHPWPADLGALLADCGASVFLQVFPVPERRPMLTAIAAGLPVILHFGYLHPMLALDDMCYPGAAIWSTIAELVDILQKVDMDWLTDQRTRIDEYMARQGSAQAVLDALGDRFMAPAPAEWVPAIQVPETYHELRRLLTEMLSLTVFQK